LAFSRLILRTCLSVAGCNFQRRRRGIFVEPNANHFSPVGAAYSDDIAPTELGIFVSAFYKDASPNGLSGAMGRRKRDSSRQDEPAVYIQFSALAFPSGLTHFAG